MRLTDLRPGWRTDFIVHRFGAEVLERDDCLVVRTPVNPTFYWGNCLVLPAGPADADLAHWLRRFADEIGDRQPLSRHVAIGVDAPFTGQQLPAWEAAGFALHAAVLLRLTAAPPPAAAGDATHARALLHRLDARRDADAVVDLECSDTGGFEPAGHRRYLQAQWRRHAAMQDAGVLRWFGMRAPDGRLLASCGLLLDPPEAAPDADPSAGAGAGLRAAPIRAARLQRVLTHPQARRRGLARALVAGVARHALHEAGAAALWVVADPHDVAIRLYESLGGRRHGSAWSLQRNAPQDGAAGRPAARGDGGGR